MISFEEEGSNDKIKVKLFKNEVEILERNNIKFDSDLKVKIFKEEALL